MALSLPIKDQPYIKASRIFYMHQRDYYVHPISYLSFCNVRNESYIYGHRKCCSHFYDLRRNQIKLYATDYLFVSDLKTDVDKEIFLSLFHRIAAKLVDIQNCYLTAHEYAEICRCANTVLIKDSNFMNGGLNIGIEELLCYAYELKKFSIDLGDTDIRVSAVLPDRLSAVRRLDDLESLTILNLPPEVCPFEMYQLLSKKEQLMQVNLEWKGEHMVNAGFCKEMDKVVAAFQKEKVIARWRFGYIQVDETGNKNYRNVESRSY